MLECQRLRSRIDMNEHEQRAQAPFSLGYTLWPALDAAESPGAQTLLENTLKSLILAVVTSVAIAAPLLAAPQYAFAYRPAETNSYAERDRARSIDYGRGPCLPKSIL